MKSITAKSAIAKLTLWKWLAGNDKQSLDAFIAVAKASGEPLQSIKYKNLDDDKQQSLIDALRDAVTAQKDNAMREIKEKLQ